jgi:hypothetical protein
VKVSGAVTLLHGSDGSRRVRRSSELALGVGESAFLDGDRPAAADVTGVEAILRVVSTASRTIVDSAGAGAESRRAKCGAWRRWTSSLVISYR